MEKVNGIGGLFFPAKDPDGLAEWSFTHLGISLVTMDDDELPWWQEAGPSGIAPPFLRRRSTLAIPRKPGWLIFVYPVLTPWFSNRAPRGFPLRWTGNLPERPVHSKKT